MKRKNVLIISYHSSLNNGDRALLEVNMSQLKKAFSEAQITVAAAWPDEPYFQAATSFKVIPSAWQLIGIKGKEAPLAQIFNTFKAYIFACLFRAGFTKLIPPGWIQLFEAYKTADIVASVSSTHFYTSGRFGWPFPVKILMVQLAFLFKKPFYVMPQSIGPLRWDWEKKLLKDAYKKARIVFLRDEASMRLAEKIQLPPEKVRFAPDPTFAYEPESQEKALKVLNRYGFDPSLPAIGMTLIPWQGRWISEELMSRYYRSFVEFLRRFNQETGVQVYLFNQVTGPTRLDDDRIAAKIVKNILSKDENWFKHVDETLGPATLKACYGCMDLFLATRMHSGIFALGMKVPVIFIGYMDKTRGLMEWLGLEDWVVELNDFTSEILLEKVRLAWNEKPTRREKLEKLIPPICQQVYEISDLIREDANYIS